MGLLLAIAFAVVLPAGADAGNRRMMADPPRSEVEKEKFVLDFGDSYFRGMHGGGAVLHLKRALKQQYPWVDVSDYRLKKVVLVAKTKFGRGHAQLRVGPEFSDRYRIKGRPHSFNDNRKKTFDRVNIRSPYHDSWGPWRLQLHGIFKVKKVVLVAERRKHHHYGWAPHNRPRPQYRQSAPYDGSFYFNMWW